MKVSPIEKQLKHHDFMSSTGFYIRSSLREARRRKLYFCLAITSTFIVVAATAVSQTIMDYTPLIFLKTSEADTGSIDVQLTSYTVSFLDNDGINTQSVTKNLLLNTTVMQSQVDPIFPKTTTPRYTFYNATIGKTLGSCTSSNLCLTSQFVLQDTVRETQLGMATDPKLPTEIPYGGLVMCSKFAKSLQASVGDVVYLNLVVAELLKELVIQFNSRQAIVTERIPQSVFASSKATIPFRVETIVDNMSGKYPDGTIDYIITEYQYFFQILANYMPSVSNTNYPRFIEYVRNENPKDYASQMLFNLKDRLKVYRNSNFDIIQDQVTSFGSKITNALGVFPYDISLPVFQKLSDLKFAGLFLGIVLTIIIVVLFILSTILIYNLLLVTVETKSFEFGVIRMLGLTKYGIGQLILVQALMFALPGLILGLLLSVPLLMLLGGYLGTMLSTDIPKVPSGIAVFWSILIGIAIPIISSYYPMKEALGKNLNLSLDLVHSKTNSVQISIEIGSKRFPWTEITFGILTVAFGIGIYIILPLSLISFELGLLLSMFFVILIGLLVGLTILSLNFQHLMARLVTNICFFWTSTSFKSLILKNLLAHKLRNRQTAIMYSLALGFIIFILVTLNQELASMAYQAQARRGALLEFKSSYALDTKRLDDLMANKLNNVVESYTFISFDLTTFVQAYGAASSVTLTHKGQLYEYTPTIKAVSPSIFKTTLNDFLVIDKQDTTTGLDLGEQLYTPRGTQGAIIGQTYRDQLGITDNLDSSLIFKLENGADSSSEELRLVAALESAPAFKFSKLPSQKSQDVLISFPTYARLAKPLTKSVNDVPVEKLLVKVKGDSSANLDAVFTELNKLKQEDSTGSIRLWDYRDTQKRITSNQNTLSFIFKAVEILVMLLTMFSLITSMSTNIMEQTKEIAVLRAIGLTKLKVNLLYVCEAFVLIISSAIFGIIIGTAVAWTLSIQRVLFTQLPMTFTFPGFDLILIFAVAIFSAFISSYFPAKRVTRHQISKIIRLGS